MSVCVDTVPDVCNVSGESVCGYCTWCVNVNSVG